MEALVSIRINLRERIISNICIEIQALRIIQLCIWYGFYFGAPIGRHEPSH